MTSRPTGWRTGFLDDFLSAFSPACQGKVTPFRRSPTPGEEEKSGLILKGNIPGALPPPSGFRLHIRCLKVMEVGSRPSQSGGNRGTGIFWPATFIMHDDIILIGVVIPGLTRNPVFSWIPAFARMTILRGIRSLCMIRGQWIVSVSGGGIFLSDTDADHRHRLYRRNQSK